jgi:hypothetical protein
VRLLARALLLSEDKLLAYSAKELLHHELRRSGHLVKR